MFDRFDVWQYSDDHNCWDFVREYLIEKAGVNPNDVPKYGILPSSKREMTEAARSVAKNFVESKPVDYAVACQYHGKILQHVGVVFDGKVHHTGSKIGTKKEPISKFERNAQRTIYMSHISLCQL